MVQRFTERCLEGRLAGLGSAHFARLFTVVGSISRAEPAPAAAHRITSRAKIPAQNKRKATENRSNNFKGENERQKGRAISKQQGSDTRAGKIGICGILILRQWGKRAGSTALHSPSLPQLRRFFQWRLAKACVTCYRRHAELSTNSLVRNTEKL